MPSPSEVIDEALGEVDALRKLLKKKNNRQVRSNEERSIAKANALAWFNQHRADLSPLAYAQLYAEADEQYRALLEASDHASDRKRYDAILKHLRGTLTRLRAESVTASVPRTPTTDDPPAFSPLITDGEMQQVLNARWRECVACLGAKAPLSATVMMGGLVEGLLLARINRETNQASVFKAKVAPRDRQGKTRPLSEWTLKNYMDVVHELGWISESAKDIGDVLRDYRNLIHPLKQVTQRTHLTVDDAQMLWEVSKAVTREVIRSAGKS